MVLTTRLSVVAFAGLLLALFPTQVAATACLPGTYSSSGQSPCWTCPGGTYADSTHTSLSEPRTPLTHRVSPSRRVAPVLRVPGGQVRRSGLGELQRLSRGLVLVHRLERVHELPRGHVRRGGRALVHELPCGHVWGDCERGRVHALPRRRVLRGVAQDKLRAVPGRDVQLRAGAERVHCVSRGVVREQCGLDGVLLMVRAFGMCSKAALTGRWKYSCAGFYSVSIHGLR